MRAAIYLLILLVVAQFIAPGHAGATNLAHTNAEWLKDYNQALAKSRQTGKSVFVDCFAVWCMWCYKLEDEVYSDPQFSDFMQDYILLRIETDDGGQGSRLAEQFRVETLPTMLVIDSTGKVINRIGGYLSTKELISNLEKIQKLIDRERANPNDWVAVRTLADEYMYRDMNSEAEIRLSRILQAPLSDYEKESAHFSLALAQYYQQRNEEALNTLNHYLEKYVDGRSAEDVLLLQSQIYLDLDETDKARRVLQRFLQIFPNSKSAGKVREVLSKL